MLLNNYRKKIDEIDEKIINLLCDRFINVKKIGKIKKENKLTIFDSEREKFILNNIELLCKDTTNKQYVVEVFKEIFRISKIIQE